MAFLAAGAISAAATATWPLFCKYIAGQKGKQTLDPVYTICTLAIKVFDAYKDGLPGVYDNAFWLTTEKATRFTWLNRMPKMKDGVRAYYGLTHEDMGLLLPNIRLFTKHWKAEQEPELLEIAKWAVQGLQKIPKSPTYIKENGDCKYPNVESLSELYAEILNNWISKATYTKSTVTPPNVPQPNALSHLAALTISSPLAAEATSSPTIEPTLEEGFVQQIKTNWTGQRLRDFVTRHRQGMVGELETFLMDLHRLHKHDLQKALDINKQLL